MMHAFSNLLVKSGQPFGADDALLRAITLADGPARDAFLAFEQGVDFEALPWSSYRLLSILSRRLPSLAPDTPLRQRISGIEKSVWTRSQVAVAEAAPLLRALHEADIPLMMIKGAGWAAQRLPILQGRLVNDIDVCVPPECVQTAFDLATANGWMPSGAGSSLFHRARLDMIVGINLIKGRFGNLDLHRTMFHVPHNRTEFDPNFWALSGEAHFGTVPVRVPCSAHGVAIALAHGAREEHGNLDWIVDMCAAIAAGIDWSVLEEEIDHRRLEAMAAMTFDYLSSRLAQNIPEFILRRGMDRLRRYPFKSLFDLAEVPPRERSPILFRMVRPIAKQIRLLRRRRQRHIKLPKFNATTVVPSAILPKAEAKLRHRLDVFEMKSKEALKSGEGWQGMMDVRLQLQLPEIPRKLYLELNSAKRHIARIRIFERNLRKENVEISLQLPLSLGSEDQDLFIEAFPAQRFNDGDPLQTAKAYEPVPFHLLEATLVKKCTVSR